MSNLGFSSFYCLSKALGGGRSSGRSQNPQGGSTRSKPFVNSTFWTGEEKELGWQSPLWLLLSSHPPTERFLNRFSRFSDWRFYSKLDIRILLLSNNSANMFRLSGAFCIDSVLEKSKNKPWGRFWGQNKFS